MNLGRQFVFWLIALLMFIFLLWLLSDILLPFIAGLVLAYLLDPVADGLERLGLPRLAATLLILILSVVGLTVILLLLLPALGEQIANFAKNLPGYITTLVRVFNEAAPDWLKELVRKSETNVSGSVTDVAGKVAVWIGTLLASLWSGGLALVNLLSLIVVTPIVAFYLLNDWDRMVAKVDSWLPRQHAETIRDLARQMNEAMAGFIRGQGTVCLSLGVFYAVGLSLAGLNFGLLIGFAAGMLSFIPFAGTIIGGVTAIGMALVQFWPDWGSIIVVFAIFVAGQFIEGNFLSPKLVGDRVGLHPVWLMFALFAFGYLFGFVGLLLAVPLAASAGVLIRFGLRQYLKSPFYLGSPAAADGRRPTPEK